MTTLREVAQQVRDRADIVEIVRGFVELRRVGSQYKGLCPFHREKTPSFHVHPVRQGWHCFGCGKSGSVIDFIMGMEKLEFVEALEMLAGRLGIEMPQRLSRDPERAKEADQKRDALLSLNQWALQWFRANLKAEPQGLVGQYLQRRQIKPALVEEFQLGASPMAWRGLLEAATAKGFSEELLLEAGLIARSNESGNLYDRFRGRLVFPILDHLGRCLGFGGRVVVEEPGKTQAKYVNSSETPIYHKGRTLYGLHQAQQAIEKKQRALLVEGNIDCIMAHQGGFPETVATLGTALTPDQARLLRRFCSNVVLVYDGDEAGQKAMKRGGEVLVRAGLQVQVAVLPPEHDPDSLVRETGSEGFARFIDGAVDLYQYFLQLAMPKDGTAEILHRIAAVDSIAPLLMALESPVERNLRIKDVARQVGVDVPAIEEFLARRDKRRGAGRPAGLGTQRIQVQPAMPVGEEWGAEKPAPFVPLLELAILRGIVEEEPFTEWVRDNLEPVWLDPMVSNLIGMIIDLKSQGEFDPLEFQNRLEDKDLRNLYASALFKDDLVPPRGAGQCEEARTRLRVRHLKTCAAEWLAVTNDRATRSPETPVPAETLREFERLHKEAQECVRGLHRKVLVVNPSVRIP